VGKYAQKEGPAQFEGMKRRSITARLIEEEEKTGERGKHSPCWTLREKG